MLRSAHPKTKTPPTKDGVHVLLVRSYILVPKNFAVESGAGVPA